MANRRMFSLLLSLLFVFHWANFAQSADSRPFTDFERNYNRTFPKPLENNPDCPKQSHNWCGNSSSYSRGKITYVLAEGKDDEIHHLFSTIGAPSLLMARTKKKTGINITYADEQDGNHAIGFYSPPQHVLSIVFPQLYEYEDHKDTANMSDYDKNNKTGYIVHDLSNLTWGYNPAADESSKEYKVVVVNATAPADASNTSLLQKDAYISFRIRYDTKDGRLDGRPHMEFTANSSMITIEMSNLTTKFARSRFAIEQVMITTGDGGSIKDQDATSVNLRQSMDDEYSPGVFQMRNWLTDLQKPEKEPWGYAQWKPVVYTKRERLNADLSHAVSYPNYPMNKNDIINTTLHGRSIYEYYFGGDAHSVSLNATKVSFGITEDGFYDNTKFLVWTMGVGIGPAPEDDVSTLVILVIAVGLGIPLVLMIFASVFVCVKNYRSKANTGYTSINT